ncbi:ABC transporter ATP-binding protein [Thiohalocapsa sp.]|uniref:ABC transporter ATP-binding protein n=1 Tax=Thiohalocapsa sp. TaxID=2497641 RepID=UPI0025EDCB66|nr:ATP-binding cassette domain-containing protein [Thiohalocapsa sp.]
MGKGVPAQFARADAQGDERLQQPGNGAGAEPLVRIRGLHFAHGGKVIFDGIDLDIQRGAVTAIMGPSGTGKTTLLKLISGQLKPNAGSIEVDGEAVHHLNRQQLCALRKRMGMLFQSGALLGDLSVFENVAFPLREHARLPESLLRRLVLMKLEAVGLRGAAALMPSQLSGGMARRVALARAVALDPMMVMYDEPFTGQDPISMGVLVQLVHQLNDAGGISSIIVSHDVPETLGIADHAYVIAEGRVMCSGTPEQVSAHADPRVRQFLDGAPDGPVHFHYPSSVPLAQDMLASGEHRGWW